MSISPDEINERAKRSAHISIVFEAAVKRIFGAHAIEMTRPEGGARATLYIHLIVDERSESLTRRGGEATPTSYALGWANPAEGIAQLYTLGHTLAHSKKTRGRELVLRPFDYTRFLETAIRVLEDFGMKVTLLAYTKNDVEVEIKELLDDEGGNYESDEDAAAIAIAIASMSAAPPPRTPTIPYLGLHREGDAPSSGEARESGEQQRAHDRRDDGERAAS